MVELNNISKLACVRIYNMAVMAEIAKGLLESNGIKACVSGTDFRPSVEFAAGIRLWVNEEDKEKAIGVLKSYDKQSR